MHMRRLYESVDGRLKSTLTRQYNKRKGGEVAKVSKKSKNAEKLLKRETVEDEEALLEESSGGRDQDEEMDDEEIGTRAKKRGLGTKKTCAKVKK